VAVKTLYAAKTGVLTQQFQHEFSLSIPQYSQSGMGQHLAE